MSNTNKLTSDILEYLLRLPHCFAWRQNTQGVFDRTRGIFRPAPKRGVCDIIGVYRSLFFGIEVKTGSDTLRIEQKSFIASVHRSGGIILVVDSYSSFIAQFERIIKNTQSPA